jgi:hypothetical protein
MIVATLVVLIAMVRVDGALLLALSAVLTKANDCP